MFQNKIITGNFSRNTTQYEKFSCPVHDTNNGRYYEVSPGVFYPSITTVLGESVDLQWWRDMKGEVEAERILKTASARGTQMHDLLEKYLSNVPININSENYIIKSNFLNGRNILDKINNIHLQETVLCSHKLKVAGRVDVVGEFDKIDSIIDFKTANKTKNKDYILNYFCQAAAYGEMMHEMYGFTAKQIVIIIFVDGGPAPQVFQETPEQYIKVLSGKIANFKGKFNGR